MGVVANKVSDCINWLPWGNKAFSKAHADQKPILLAIGTAWCHWCAEMLQTTYCDRTVSQLIERRFIPVWVDAERRPDINERYNLGGWPTTAFLTPAGHLLGGETYIGPERMAELLDQVADAFVKLDQKFYVNSQDEILGMTSMSDREFDPDSELEAWFSSYLIKQFDSHHGGFGTKLKRVHAQALQFAFHKHAEGHEEFGAVAVQTLDAIGWGGLYDDIDGGVFRYCAGRDWTSPSVEKLLTVNAEVLHVLLTGSLVMNEKRYRERASGLIQYITEVLADRPGGGFFASQHADVRYYAADASGRRSIGSPPVDPVVYSDTTAQMVSAFVYAFRVFNDSSLLEFAVTSLERVIADTYQRGQGIAHNVSEVNPVRGLLADQVFVSDALLDLYEVTQREVYLDMAQELMRFAVRELSDVAGFGFIDRVIVEDDVGLLRKPLTPFAINCTAARVMVRLGRLTGAVEFRERAIMILKLQAANVRSHGIEAAPYILAMREV